MSESNIKGMFERACRRWHFGAIYICPRMGRGATGALQTAGLLLEHTSRALFHRDGQLVAFPGLHLLARLAGVNEKTIRRAINRLEEAGLVRTQQRYDDSNLYYLTTPPDAEAHLFACEAAITKGRRARPKRPIAPDIPPDMTAPKCPDPRTDGNVFTPKCPPNSEYNSDLHSISKRHDLASCHLLEYQKEKRVGEEERVGEPQCSPTNLESRTADTPGVVPRATTTTTPTHFTYEEAQARGLGPPAPRFEKIRHNGWEFG